MKRIADLKLEISVSELLAVGPTYVKRLAKLNVQTINDLLYHFPFRYQDYSLISKIALIQPGETVTIFGQVLESKNIYTKTGKKIQQVKISDSSGTTKAIWFNQPFLIKSLCSGQTISLSGKVDWFGRELVMISPEYEIINHLTSNHQPLTIHTGRLVPVYPETYGLSSKWLRSRIYFLLNNFQDKIVDFLPTEIRLNNNLLDLKSALWQIHFPDNKKMADLAKTRLAFDELFLIQLASEKRKIDWEKKVVGNKFRISDFKPQINQFLENLPFRLTFAQRRCVGEILTDLAKDTPMNRLLEGDVGSGKTVVAAIAMQIANLNGFQAAMMCPTEILAEQHYKTVTNLLSPFKVKIAIQTGSRKTVQKIKNQNAKLKITTQKSKVLGDYDIVIGTHALLTENLNFKKLGLIVIDEQHRFGVEQRAVLREKGTNPHVLTMTATPIPRTLALTLYGDLDLSIIDEMPSGRVPIKTWVVPPQKRQPAYEWIKKRIMNYELGVKEEREQAFIICPLIEESETLKTVRAATKEFERLKKGVFPNLRLGLLHGRMKPKEKDKILQDFRNGQLDILIATPVVEVGIDIPGATIMVVETAERFGLAQLHQLRGRVGRRNQQSYCLLFTDIWEKSVVKRLKAMETMSVGAKLAEFDLRLRGPGEVYGLKQHGLPDLRIASLTDKVLIEKSKKAADWIISQGNHLLSFPHLKEKLEKYTISSVKPD